MGKIFFVICGVTFSILFGGCVSSGPAPQDVHLRSQDGKAVIIKDIYELPLIENKKLQETEIVKVFFPKQDNVRTNCSITLLKIPSGVSPAKYKQTSSQIIYAISGGGKLLIDNNMIVLKKGIMVYVPPNAAMSITNNVDKILELIVVTSPPFEIEQMTILGDKPERVRVTKDSENAMNDNDEKVQALSEKYKPKKRGRERTLSVEEYRSRIGESLTPAVDEKDSIPDWTGETKEVKKEKNFEWPLKMPDSSKVPLKELEEEQKEKLIPKQPQKVEKTSLKNIQELTPEEHAVPIRGEDIKPAETKSEASKDNQDSLEKLLEDQKKKQGEIIPKKTPKLKKTGLKPFQELNPEENKSDKMQGKASKEQDLLEQLLRDQKKQQEKLVPMKIQKVKQTSLEDSPDENAVQ